jgi:hypothetical protein
MIISIIGAVISLVSGWRLVSIASLIFSGGRGVMIVNQVAFSAGMRTLVNFHGVLSHPSFQRGVSVIFALYPD